MKVRINHATLTEKDEKHHALLSNAYYMFMEAADMILRTSEELLVLKGCGMEGEVKMRHNRMMQKVTAMKNESDNFQKSYDKAFGRDYKKQDSLRHTAGVLARLGLLALDRCGDGTKEGGRRARQIEEYIYFMPEGGQLTDAILKRFKVR